MKQFQFFFLFAAVYLAPKTSEETSLAIAVLMTVMGFFYWVKGDK